MENEWRPITELRQIDHDISDYVYSKEYIEKYKLLEKKSPHVSEMIKGRVNFFEPIEVAEIDGEIVFKEHNDCLEKMIPDSFTTQYGTFENHNHGEFFSWLGKDGYDGVPESERGNHLLFGRRNFYVEGNFCDMFDCGAYSYAVSNLRHLVLGRFKIVKIGEDLKPITVFENRSMENSPELEYLGRFPSANGEMLVVSGRVDERNDIIEEYSSHYLTLLLQIGIDGSVSVYKELDFMIPSTNSLVRKNSCIYFGNNKMVTCLDIQSWAVCYLTNKNEEEIEALSNMWE